MKKVIIIAAAMTMTKKNLEDVEAEEEEDSAAAAQLFDLLIDCAFLCDIMLSFLTGWDNQGYIVRDFNLIARNYAKTWSVCVCASARMRPPTRLSLITNIQSPSCTYYLLLM